MVRRIVAAAMLFALLLAAAPAAARTRLAGAYYYRFGEAAVAEGEPGAGWSRVDDLTDIPQRGDHSLWLRMQLPAGNGDRVALLPRLYLRFDAFVDGELVASDHDPHAGGRAWHLVPVPNGGRWLSLHVTSDYSKIGIRGDVYVGTEAEHVRAMLRDDAPTLGLVFAFLLGALIALGAALRGIARTATAGIALWTASVALWTLFYTDVRDLLVADSRLWVALWVVGLGGSTPGFLLFLRGIVQRGDRLLDWTLRVNVVGSLVGLAMLPLSVPADVSNAYLACYRVLLGVTYVVTLWLIARRPSLAHNEARALLAGYFVLLFLGVRDVLVSLGVLASFDTYSHWGNLAFISAGVWVLGKRLVAMRHKVDHYAAEIAVHATERAMMLRDMHDGLGRITTTISMLAEVAKRAPERGAPLDSISALASEGSDEIRAFMRGLDPEASDWKSLEASLRERATRVVEQLGGAYEVSVTIAPDVPNPSPYLYVHLLRVFQEALTNALKHASSPTIDVALSATSERIVLEVRNDAVTQAQRGKMGINMGAGMANMKARAQDLGGSLAFSIDGDFATVVLSIPLPLRYAGERREDELRTPDPRRDRGG